MKYSLYLLKIFLLATCLWSLTGCSEEEPQEFVQPDRLVRNLYLASVMSVLRMVWMRARMSPPSSTSRRWP